MVLAKKPQLHVEELHERLVPSVTVLDLTTPGAVATAPSGAIVEQIDPQPTGTGYVDAFVRIQATGIEQGYNTDARPLQFDEKKNLTFTHAITVGQVPVVTVNGQNYLEFNLGINQDASTPILSLDQLQIFLGGVDNLTGYANGTLAGQNPVFDINSGGAVTVKLDANLSSGNGSGDMALLVPQAAFAGANPGTFVYLYSLFGAQPGEGANGGFEQWWVPNVLPTPAEQSISGSVILSSTNAGISGVTIVLNGTDSQGNAITATTTTDVNGNFSFMNIPAGNYFITQVPPPPLILVGENLGTVNGNLSGTMDLLNDSFDNVAVGSGQNGINYVFIDSSGIVG